DRRRRRSLCDRIGAPRPRDPARTSLDEGRNDRWFWKRDLGLPYGRGTQHARERCPEDVRQSRLHEDGRQTPNHLLGRLVVVDGLAAYGGKRPVAASRPALVESEHR